ncbi:hypothetical protein YTPLAS18_18980 [Nitrospira sp.]|nr:hypothetical protein YTPLAS18_18980 [Nitrospira sp.]
MKPKRSLHATGRGTSASGGAGSRVRLVLVVCVTALLVGLWASNPSAEHYQRYLEQQLAARASTIDPSIGGEERRRLEMMIAVKGRRLMTAVVHDHTRRYTVGMASLYVSDLPDVHLTTLGFATIFVPVSGHERGILVLGRLLF